MSDIEREAFEKRFPVPNGVKWSDKQRDYTYEFIQALQATCSYSGKWQAWQAARSSSAGAVPEKVTYREVSGNVKLHNNCWQPHGIQRYVDGWNSAVDAMLTAAPTAGAVESGGVPVPSFWASEAQETEQLIDGRPRKLWWECRPGVGTPYYTHPRNGEQGGEWVRCDERLPTEADVDTEGNVWARVAAHNEVSALPPSIVQVFSEDGKITHWMPTGLKRPNPPTEREDGHENS